MSVPAPLSDRDLRRRRVLTTSLAIGTLLLLIAGLAAGSDGWSPLEALRTWRSADGALLIGSIRAPRTVGAWLAGALLGLAGAVAQGLFRNPLADPYLIGSASGASLGVVIVLAASTLGGTGFASAGMHGLAGTGLAGAAFLGALLGVLLTLALARGANETTRLLLAGVVVGVVLAAVSDLATTAAPDALRGKQAFMLGSTGFLGWNSCALLGLGLVLCVPLCAALAPALDALTLGDETARSLGLPLSRIRMALVAGIALATGIAVAETGLIAFVGLVAPHIVRRFAPSTHAFGLTASAAAGGMLLLLADVLARSLVAPREVPVGVLTALVGGGYLIWLLRRGQRP